MTKEPFRELDADETKQVCGAGGTPLLTGRDFVRAIANAQKKPTAADGAVGPLQ
jgi:hypothetical protein